MDEKTSEQFLDNFEKNYPLGRHGTPQEIANYVLFLASDKCAWVTGINFLCDGGIFYAPHAQLEYTL